MYYNTNILNIYINWAVINPARERGEKASGKYNN